MSYPFFSLPFPPFPSPSDAMSDPSSSPVNFVPLTDLEPLSSNSAASSSSSSSRVPPPAEPSLVHSWCGTRVRAARCTAVIVLVLAVVGLGAYFNYTIHSDRAELEALCDEWVNQYHLTPDAVSYCPLTSQMQLLYNDTAIPFASQLTTGTALTRRPPSIVLPSVQSGHWYAFALLDLDFPYTANTSLRAKTHHLVVNIPGGTSPLPLHDGDTLFKYVAPCPLPKEGWHRYVAVVYDQHDVHNASLAARNISMVPPAMMDIQRFLSVLVGFDLSGSLEGGTFFFGQFETLTCGLF